MRDEETFLPVCSVEMAPMCWRHSEAGHMEFILAKILQRPWVLRTWVYWGHRIYKDAGDGFSSSKPYSLGQPFTCRIRNRQIWIQAAMNNYSSIPENHTGTTLLIQSSEWGHTFAHTFRYRRQFPALTPTPREPECHFYFCENPIGI